VQAACIQYVQAEKNVWFASAEEIIHASFKYVGIHQFIKKIQECHASCCHVAPFHEALQDLDALSEF
jgi:hypothetical protein